jgi:DHA2 family multidrug resistance protein
MSAAATRAGAPAAASGAGANPWLIAVLVAFASFMENLDSTIANVVLPYIAGGLGVSVDEASWVVTTYLVANAVSLTASSFLAQLLGRRRFFLICLALFTASSLLCGYAWNLDALLLFRLAQGLGGGGMVPLAQSILADSFPPEKRGQGFALFGVAVVVAPVAGPILGGWLADNFSWRWCFTINVPVGVIAFALIAAVLPAPKDLASVQYQDTLHQTTNYFVAQGSSLWEAKHQAIQWIGQQLQAQASYLGYMDVFWLLMLISLLAVPLALTLRKSKLGGAVPAGH